jgi:hypothetical protein
MPCSICSAAGYISSSIARSTPEYGVYCIRKELHQTSITQVIGLETMNDLQLDDLLEPFPTKSRSRSDSFSLLDMSWPSLMHRFNTSNSSATKSPTLTKETPVEINIMDLEGDQSMTPREYGGDFGAMMATSTRQVFIPHKAAKTDSTMDKDNNYQDSMPWSSQGGGSDDSTGSGFNPISVASVVGDKVEFRRLQEDLRQSRMLTGVGTKQVLNKYIESRRRSVEEKNQNDEELSKVKYFEHAQRPKSSDRWSRSMRTIR